MSEESTGRVRDGSPTERGESTPEESATPRPGVSETGDPWTPVVLARIRSHPRRRRVALVLAALLGLGVTWAHWLGLFVAGALVGLVSRDLRRAAGAGLSVGMLVLVVQFVATPVGPGEFLALTPPAYVAIAAVLVAPLWGSLVRGVV